MRVPGFVYLPIIALSQGVAAKRDDGPIFEVRGQVFVLMNVDQSPGVRKRVFPAMRRPL